MVALPGDGVGPEVIDEAERLLAVVAPELRVERHLFGGAAIDAAGDPLPPETLAAARDADAVLLGAVGGPAWEGAARRPEEGLISIRAGARRLREPAPGPLRQGRPADRA